MLFYRSFTVLSIIIQIGRSVIQLRALIFSNARLVLPLELGHFHYSLPDSFPDVGLDFQASYYMEQLLHTDKRIVLYFLSLSIHFIEM